jgi:nucleoside-diphosphate-sugar epimerase
MKEAAPTSMILPGKPKTDMNPVRLKGKKVLLSGGSGFTGSHLVRHFNDAGAKVFIVDTKHPGAHRIFTDHIPALTFFQADLRNRHELADIIERIWPDIVVHLGAITSRESDYPAAHEGIASAIQGTVNLLEVLSGTDYMHFILFSSDEVYGNIHVPPFHESMHLKAISPFSAAKIAAEQYTVSCSAINKRPYTVFRPFYLYGEGQSGNMFVPQFIRKALNGIPSGIIPGKQNRDFVHIDDACRAVLSACLFKGARDEVINICSGEEVSLTELAELICELIGDTEFRQGTHECPVNETWSLFGSNAKAKKQLGWQPEIPLLEGLTRTIAWYRTNLTE